MSRLYVRVMTGFYSHRKTARLRSILGDDALWIPPRLWAYAAENQPDGDLSSYTSEEIACLIQCPKHAPSMLQALKDSGYVDEDGKIHDWEEHNGYHQTFSERAKAAADARWSKKKKERGNRNRKEDTSIASSMLVASGVVLPECLDTDEFKAVWDKWEKHRAEIKHKLTNTSIESQIKKLAAMGGPAAIASITQSIENGWQGLFEPKNVAKPAEPRQLKEVIQIPIFKCNQ